MKVRMPLDKTNSLVLSKEDVSTTEVAAALIVVAAKTASEVDLTLEEGSQNAKEVIGVGVVEGLISFDKMSI